jgi:HEAT repeat protein
LFKEALAVKPLLILLALACSLIWVTPVQAARSSTRLTTANVNDQPLSFTIKVERVKDKKKGDYLRFHVTVKAKDGEVPLSPRRATALEVIDGEAVVSSCSLQLDERGGEVSCSFLVAAKYAEKSTFLFGEDFGAPNGWAAGRFYWFYLQDFVELPLPRGNAPLSELAKKSKGALVATLLEIGDPELGPPGAGNYASKWKVEKVLRGTYPGTVHLSFRVQSIPEESREKPPVVGKKYILITNEVNANQVAAILDADEKNLRKVQDLLKDFVAALKSKDYEERSAALKALETVLAAKGDGLTDFEPVLQPLFSLAGWGGEARGNARLAEDLLVRIGGPALPLLKGRLKSEDAHDRRVAAELLVRIGPLDASLAALLRPLLADRDAHVRGAAIDGLGMVGAPAKEAVKDLEAVATSDPNHLRRVSARVALIRVAGASDERVRALAAFLEPVKERRDPTDKGYEPDAELAPRFAASQLGELKEKASAAIPQLVVALKHPDAGVRINAAAALGPVGALNSPESIAALIDTLKNDPEREARRSAAGSLGEIGPKAKAAIPALRSALKGDGKHGWWVAADALGKIGGAEAVPALVEGLASFDDGVRSTSMKSLGVLGAIVEPAIVALEKARQEDPRVENRPIAAEALRTIEQAIQKTKKNPQKM